MYTQAPTYYMHTQTHISMGSLHLTFLQIFLLTADFIICSNVSFSISFSDYPRIASEYLRPTPYPPTSSIFLFRCYYYLKLSYLCAYFFNFVVILIT